jgi:hypothetical protein
VRDLGSLCNAWLSFKKNDDTTGKGGGGGGTVLFISVGGRWLLI